ncbi:nucleoside-diphosphate kinase [Alkalibacterium sp. MB6]|uniref:nucleoside-diphosphate kinase n=1 Tax=Alkalibacterium sp. MB6 TaxID=2081965 RepID=UPI00137979EC|nr:nucleoside-diphosphate kinase [Alkalibacterium sp. MB6]
MVEEALVLIKPDAVRRQLIGSILHEYEKLGLRISHLEMQIATTERVEAHLTLATMNMSMIFMQKQVTF